MSKTLVNSSVQKRRDYQRDWERKKKRPDRYSKEKRRETNQKNYKNTYVRQTMPNYQRYIGMSGHYIDHEDIKHDFKCNAVFIYEDGVFARDSVKSVTVAFNNIIWDGENDENNKSS